MDITFSQRGQALYTEPKVPNSPNRGASSVCHRGSLQSGLGGARRKVRLRRGTTEPDQFGAPPWVDCARGKDSAYEIERSLRVELILMCGGEEGSNPAGSCPQAGDLPNGV